MTQAVQQWAVAVLVAIAAVYVLWRWLPAGVLRRLGWGQAAVERPLAVALAAIAAAARAQRPSIPRKQTRLLSPCSSPAEVTASASWRKR